MFTIVEYYSSVDYEYQYSASLQIQVFLSIIHYFFFYSNLNRIETIILFFFDNVSMRPLAKQNILFPLTLPTLIFGSYPTVFIAIFGQAPASQILNNCCITQVRLRINDPIFFKNVSGNRNFFGSYLFILFLFYENSCILDNKYVLV